MVPELDFELEMLVHTFSIRKVGPIAGFMKTSNTWVGSKVLESHFWQCQAGMTTEHTIELISSLRR